MAPQLYDPTGGLVGVNDPGHPALFGQVYSDSTTKVTLTDVEVLQAQRGLGPLHPEGGRASGRADRPHPVFADNQFTLTLRPQADTRSFDPTGYGQTNNSLFNLYAFPIPVQINVAPSASPDCRRHHRAARCPPGARRLDRQAQAQARARRRSSLFHRFVGEAVRSQPRGLYLVCPTLGLPHQTMTPPRHPGRRI